jgi:hypothetical protein
LDWGTEAPPGPGGCIVHGGCVSMIKAADQTLDSRLTTNTSSAGSAGRPRYRGKKGRMCLQCRSPFIGVSLRIRRITGRLGGGRQARCSKHDICIRLSPVRRCVLYARWHRTQGAAVLRNRPQRLLLQSYRLKSPHITQFLSPSRMCLHPAPGCRQLAPQDTPPPRGRHGEGR